MEHDETLRFQDDNLRLGDFIDHLVVQCPKCQSRAEILTERQHVHARDGGGVQYRRKLRCSACFYVARRINRGYGFGLTRDGVDSDFGTPLWLRAPFRDELFWACNYEHLDYLRRYIAAKVRERRDRRFATMVEKLPAFIKAAKNREALLKLSEKLEGK